jgi:hypothetical protein
MIHTYIHTHTHTHTHIERESERERARARASESERERERGPGGARPALGGEEGERDKVKRQARDSVKCLAQTHAHVCDNRRLCELQERPGRCGGEDRGEGAGARSDCFLF